MNAWTSKEEADSLLLAKLAGEGHTAAFDALATKYANWVIAAAYSVMKNTTDAQDAAQECWITFWNDCQKCNGVFPDTMSVPGTLWVRGRNAALALRVRRQAWKRGGRDPGLFTYELLRELHGTYRWRRHGVDYDMTERTPEEDPAKKMGMIHRLSAQLPAEHLAALDSYYFKSESLDALAQRLRVPVNRAKRILNHGIQILRHLAEEVTPAEWEAAA